MRMKYTIDGKPETEWAMEQVTRVFGFKSMDEVRAALAFDRDGVATLSKNGLSIVGTKSLKHWAPVKIVWAGVGTLQREAALQYSNHYSNT